MLILLNKPFGVLCQFTDPGGRPTLADYVRVPNVYPAGRLDHDSEGLLLLTDDGALQARLADPRHHVEKVYWVQVERVPGEDALARLRAGLVLKDGPDAAGAGAADRRAAGALAARAADPVAGGDPDRVGRDRAHRGTEPAGAADDGGGGISRAAVDPGRGRAVRARDAPAWGVAGGVI